MLKITRAEALDLAGPRLGEKVRADGQTVVWPEGCTLIEERTAPGRKAYWLTGHGASAALERVRPTLEKRIDEAVDRAEREVDDAQPW